MFIGFVFPFAVVRQCFKLSRFPSILLFTCFLVYLFYLHKLGTLKHQQISQAAGVKQIFLFEILIHVSFLVLFH